MSPVSSFGVAAWLLLAAPALPRQIPVRLLDSNGLFVTDAPARVHAGIVVGTGTPVVLARGALWDGAGSHELAPASGYSLAAAADFNAAGDVVGSSEKSLFFASIATLWRGGAPLDLNSLVTGGSSRFLATATTIDARGRVAGRSSASVFALPDRGYLLEDGIVVDLGALLPGVDGVAPARMNDHRQIVGSADVGGGLSHAVLWNDGTLIDLHDPSQISGSASAARAIDRFGSICGSAWYSFGPGVEEESAVLWEQGSVNNLGALLGTRSRASGINDFGVVVGSYFDVVDGPRACIFENGGATDLNTQIAADSGWTLEAAEDVDDEGRITGTGQFEGATRAFLLEPRCDGSFTVYGTGCTGSVGVEPRLDGVGCPSPDRDFALLVRDGVAGAAGFLFIGSSNGVARVKPGCDLQVLPLIAPPLLVVLDGFGESWGDARLPVGTPAFDVYLQCLFLAPGSRLVSATKPLHVHFE